MLEFWRSLTYTTKFSILGFWVSLVLGLLSMGILGAILYYPVCFLFASYPSINDWYGDWVWPAVIAVGMAWSLGFVFGGLAWKVLDPVISSKFWLRIIYGLILWAWAAMLWFIVIRKYLVE